MNNLRKQYSGDFDELFEEDNYNKKEKEVSPEPIDELKYEEEPKI